MLFRPALCHSIHAQFTYFKFQNLLTDLFSGTVSLVTRQPVGTNVFPHHFHITPYTSWVYLFICFLWRCGPTRAMSSSFLRFLDHTQRRITVGRTPLDASSARRRDLYLTTQNTHNRQTSMPPVGFEPTISAGERPQTYALDRAATGTGSWVYCFS